MNEIRTAQGEGQRLLRALASSGMTVLGLLTLMWLVTQIGAHRRPPGWGEVLGAGLRQALHAPALAIRVFLVLVMALVARYSVLEGLRWLIWIPRMARSRVAYAVLPPIDFAPSSEAVAAFTADLLGMRRRILAWLDREATAFVVGLTTDVEGRPLMYWEFPARFERELEAARSFYPGLQLVPLRELLPPPATGRRMVRRRLELRSGRPERFPMQVIAEQTDPLQAFAGVLNTVRVEAGQRLEQRTYLLPVPPSLLTRVRRALVSVARGQEMGDPLASVQGYGDRFNPAEAVERRIERQGLWAKLGRAEPMFRVQILVEAVAPADGRLLRLWDRSEAAGGLVKAVFGAWEQWAGQNYLRSVGWPVLGGLAVLFGANSWLRGAWFDYRWRAGIMGRGKVWTSWELWPLLKPWTRFCKAPRILRRLGIDLPPPDDVPEDGMLICLSA